MKDHQLGLNAYDQGPGFWGISRRVEAELDAVIADDYLWGAPRPLPDHIARFNGEQFKNPDGSYTQTPAQAALSQRIMGQQLAQIAASVKDQHAQREKVRRAQEAYAPIAKQLDKMDREPDQGELTRGQLWMGRPVGGDVACSCDACKEARNRPQAVPVIGGPNQDMTIGQWQAMQGRKSALYGRFSENASPL